MKNANDAEANGDWLVIRSEPSLLILPNAKDAQKRRRMRNDDDRVTCVKRSLAVDPY